MKEPLRVAIAGTGNIAKVHAEALAATGSRLAESGQRASTLVAVMEVDEARLTSFGQEFGTRSASAFSRVPVTPGQLAPGTPFYGQMNGRNLAW